MMPCSVDFCRWILVFGLAALMAVALGCTDTPGMTCDEGDDCSSGEVCHDGVCVDDGDAPDAGFGDDVTTHEDVDDSDDVGADAGDDDEELDCPDGNTCEAMGVECGWIPDGCGGAINCGYCSFGGVCGIGEEAGQCVDAGCEPTGNCSEAGVECGAMPDGCGGVIDCGECDGDAVCGTGVNAGVCLDGDCDPLTCNDYDPGECGVHPDGCGGFIDCGSCLAVENCETDAEEGLCEPIDCDPLTCSDYSPGECGPHPDGCGGFIDCGTCDGDQICGSGDDLGECIDFECEPLTCDDYDDVNCGQVSDGCGGLTADCGDCEDPEICGGGGQPNVCGADQFSGACDNLCEDQVVCAGGDATTLEGTVLTPNEQLPIANATVYVPNDPLDSLPPVESATECVKCEDMDLGSPLVGTVADHDGTFELRHVPADTEFPLVIRHGQWRRVVMIDPVPGCETEVLSSEQTRLPTKNEEESEHDRIPDIAVTTGSWDALECLPYQIGIDSSEFSNEWGDGAITIFDNGGSSGFTSAWGGEDFTSPDGWWDDVSNFEEVDMTFFSCSGGYGSPEALQDFADQGGRSFMTDLQKSWLELGTSDFQSVAGWGGSGAWTDESGEINTSFSEGQTMNQWMSQVGGLDASGFVQLQEVVDQISFVNETLATTWIYSDQGGSDKPHYFAFNTPVGVDADDQCGRVVYSEIHIAAGGDSEPYGRFPDNCGSTANLSGQELALIYMFLDLAGCVTEDDDPPDPECEPMDCGDQNAECGYVSDGCGGTEFCGECPDGTACGAGDDPNVCAGDCNPLSCEDHDADCGTVNDGCGGTIDCGECPDGTACGAGGVPNVCGCNEITCDDHDAECGEVPDGCGGTIDCGECPDGQECGGGGEANVCGGDCNPLSCEDHGAECGEVADGCGGTIDCGDCPDPDTCGGGGEPNTCGCTPLTCDDHDAECGEVTDGCGETLDCGECPADQICEDFQCVTPECLPDGAPCEESWECCSNLCAFDGAEGSCISQ